MSTSPQNNPNDQEIDLGQLSKKIGQKIQSFIDWLFSGILFFIRHKYIIAALIVLGVALGYFMDKKSKKYENQIIVQPNFGSTDYLYAKVDLLNRKIKENDTVFLKQIGIQSPKKFRKIEVEPILDVYQFINNKEKNYELLKLMSEDGDIKKIVEENITSKNYPYHLITYITREKTSDTKTLKPILDFLNDSDYYKKMQAEHINNLHLKMKANDSTIAQINGLLNKLSYTIGRGEKSDNLVYYNENTQLNDVIETKDKLVVEQGANRVDLINSDSIIKENSHVLNLKQEVKVYTKMKLLIPIVLIALFAFFANLKAYYKRQMAKRNLA